MKNDDQYLILSASCKLVRGGQRAIIIDYERRNVYFISLEYNDLLRAIDRRMISDIRSEMEDDESVENLYEFIKFIEDNEIGFRTTDLHRFPPISEEIVNEPRDIKNAILELDEKNFDSELLFKTSYDLQALGCIDIQIRLYSEFNPSFIEYIVKHLLDRGIRYIEVHCVFSSNCNLANVEELVENNPILGRIFMYESPELKKHIVKRESVNGNSVILGEIYYVTDIFDCNNCCGIINLQTLDFSTIYAFNRLKKQNGCLYKKVAIDCKGNIKNCPSFDFDYGNVTDNKISDIVNSNAFRKYWFINKDEIDICKECEFRYNCTDCRVFITDTQNIFSKPSRCKYNIVSGVWE